MSGQGDDKAEQVIVRCLGEGPADVLDLLAALRQALPGALQLHEGAVHALLHGALRSGTIASGGRSARGLTLYRRADQPEPPRAASGAHPMPAPEPNPVAIKVASGVRDPGSRGRVLDDVRAHLAELEAEGTGHRFGNARSARQLVHRADRGRPSVALVASGSDTARRLLLHEGPWIFGAILVFFILKLFIVQVYRIPSKSMVPALEVGDRVAVLLLGRGNVPERWSIVTFERGGITYVKRLIGLPGEEIAILFGDVYIDGTMLVKPDEVREVMRGHVRAWDFSAGAPEGWVDGGSGALAWKRGGFPAHPPSGLGNSFVMRDGYAVLHGRRGVAGTLGLTVRRGPGGSVDGATTAWTLEVNATGIALSEEVTAADGSVRRETLAERPTPPSGADLRLRLSYVDGVLRAGCSDWSFTQARAAPDSALGLRVAARGADTALERLVLDRDLHYAHLGTQGVPSSGQRGRNAHLIAKDAVFVMGDNTTDSKDSRYREAGDIPTKALIGPVRIRIWPPSRWGRVR